MVAYFFDNGRETKKRMNVPIVSQLRDFSEKRVTRRAVFYSPVYSLRRNCAHGEFENIVTEVGQIRQTVTMYFPICVNKE